MASVKQIAKQLDWPIDKNSTNGTMFGYDLALIQHVNVMANNPAYKQLVVSYEAIEQSQAELLLSFIKENQKELRIREYKVERDFINIIVNENFKGLNHDRLEEVMNKLSEGFKKSSIVPQSSCIYCNEDSNGENVVINKIFVKAHKQCHEDATKKYEEAKKEVNNGDANYPMGVLGAVFGGVIGAIPWILVEWFIGLFAAILSVLIGYSAFYFYKKFGGVVTDKTKWIIVTVTVLGIFFTQLIIATLILINAGAAIIFDNYVVLYTDPELAPIMLESLGFAVVLGGLGLFSVYRKVKSEEL